MSRGSSLFLATITVTLALTACGCGVQQKAMKSPPGPPSNQVHALEGSRVAADAAPGGKADEPAKKDAAPIEPRRIIYTAHLDVVVADLDTARVEVSKLLNSCGGYPAKSDVRNDTGTRRTATYTLRVPVDHFWQLVDALAALGTPERNAADSQDVTEEFIDVQARTKTLKAEEDALNKLLRESGSRDDILKTREAIRVIRADIERADARLNYLSKSSAMSTVNLTLKEIRDYVPPTAPTFGNRVTQTFGSSWGTFVEFVEGIALVAVALTPWLPIAIPLGIVAYWLLRRVLREFSAQDAARARHAANWSRGSGRPVAVPVQPDPPPGEVPPTS